MEGGRLKASATSLLLESKSDGVPRVAGSAGLVDGFALGKGEQDPRLRELCRVEIGVPELAVLLCDEIRVGDLWEL